MFTPLRNKREWVGYARLGDVISQLASAFGKLNMCHTLWDCSPKRANVLLSLRIIQVNLVQWSRKVYWGRERKFKF